MTLSNGRKNPNQKTSPSLQRQMTIETTEWDHNQVTKNIKSALDNGHTMQVIHETTNAIQILQTEFSLMLRLRAMAYAREGQYKQELEDALSMVTYAPHDPAGYLYLSCRYIYQGYQQRAMDVLDQGLAQVPDTHPSYELLLQGKEQTQIRLDHRVNFFTCLPYDIICRIIEFIPESTITHCSRVSSAWRNIVLNHPVLWRTMYAFGIFTDKNNNTSFSRARLLPSVSRHIETFFIVPFMGDDVGIRCLQLFKTCDFPNLHTLKISYKQNTPEFYPAFCFALSRISNTLRDLDISSTRSGDIPTVSTLLSACQHLTSLRYQVYGKDNRFIPFTLPHSSTSLTRFELDTNEKIGGVELLTLLQSSPHLSWLSIGNCDVNDFYPVIQKYGTALKVLIVGRTLLLNWRDSNKWYTNLDPKDQGLASISVSPHTIGPGFVKLLEHHCITLGRINLDQSPTHYREEEEKTLTNSDWYKMSTFDFKNLYYLKLTRTANDTTRQHLGRMLTHMPHLSVLLLEGIIDPLSHDTFHALQNMSKLCDLLIIQCKFDVSDMHSFLTTLAENSTTSSPLITLQIQGGSMDETAMEITGQIKSLKTLKVSTDSKSSRASVETFVQYLSQLPQLEQLYLVDIDLIPKDLHVLATIKLLKSIELYSVGGITQEDVDTAFPPHVDAEFQSPDDVNIDYGIGI
ncbi:hypothetical protein BDA99DRAFT_494391 [Phascolomyces articulosus]|uniref:F-box domain-containing protein n=1 Tax=Phascolomyces articulosus TaxID=60185 RepID=A0AAD5PIL6_9FUNG|nr:hypothetical protein BDA99DRAFT_494391 [Phascolomyces articulosus]